MATNFSSWAILAHASDITESMKSIYDIFDLFPKDESSANALSSCSRSDWLLRTIEEIAIDNGLNNLASLHRPFSVISAGEVQPTIREIDSIFILSRSNPEYFSKRSWLFESSDEVLLSLEISKEATTPYFGPDKGEDGDTLKYLFDWLKSLRALLITAKSNGLCLIHVAPSP
jgi:hypothetical protein